MIDPGALPRRRAHPRLLGAAAAAGYSLMVPAASAASFDCSRMASVLERRVCADAELSGADTALYAAYSSALRAAGPAAPVARQGQTDWLDHVSRNSG